VTILTNSTASETAAATSGTNGTNTSSAKNTSVVYSYGASASSTTQVYWSLVVVAFLSVFATFLL
jgi:hypothetical protein